MSAMRVPLHLAIAAMWATVLVLLQSSAVTAVIAGCPSECHGNYSDSGYEASWCYKGDEVHFCVSAATTGWVGIGFSNNQNMPGSDIALGGMDTNSNSFIYDMFADARSRPPVDMEQNLECTTVTRDGDRVSMCFKRKKVTGDDRDLSLDECQNFLYAWGGTVGNNPPETLMRHQMRKAPNGKVCPPSLETCPGPQCAVQGQEYFDSSCKCVPCTGTCDEPNQICTAECRSGCGCPVGTVLDEEANACVNETDCPKVCPVEGQEYFDIAEGQCVPCTGTCNEPIQVCALVCRSGCGCPVGTVLDEEANACVNETDCPKVCPVEGQEYFDIAEGQCVPCTGTCNEPIQVCALVCRSGCGCPVGTVLDEEANACVNETDCPKDCKEGDMTYQHGEKWECSDGCNSCFCSNGVVATTLIFCDPCVARPVTGPCRASFPRYYYNTESGKCEMFTYGGCQGNQNNFETLTECTKECALKLNGVCSLPAEPGPCRGSFQNYFYNSSSMECEEFIYGGCPGNENNFVSKADCQECCGCPHEGMRYYDCAPCTGTCEEPNVPCPLVCSPGCACPVGTVLDEGKCINVTECNKANCREGDMTYQHGETWLCSDGCNTCFCSNGVVVTTLIFCDPCVARPVTGPCRGSFPRYYYNTESGKCEMFTYGGCQGNQNNFETLTECTKECALKLNGVCSLPAESGPCRAYFPRYFYNATTMECEQFIYGGCLGNANNFNDKYACQECCGCPYKGMRYYDTTKGECAPCTNTCGEPVAPCPAVCRSGCACPPGTVLHDEMCIPTEECPMCPVKGQEYFDVDEGQCVPCTGTCDEPNQVCALVCRSGCGCPVGTVLDEEANACVNVTDCPKVCPVEGQEYFDIAEGQCVPCTGTCDEPIQVCALVCHSGCGCPSGTVLDEEANACVNVTDCSKDEPCPEECTPEFCQENVPNTDCSVPGSTPSACTGRCRVTKCRACFYSKTEQGCPTECEYGCGEDPETDSKCFKQWSKCVADNLTDLIKKRKKQKAKHFQCVDPCDCQAP